MTEFIDSISPPFDAAEIVLIEIDPDGIICLFTESAKVPENENCDGPLPSLPSVRIYVAVIILPSSNFLPIIPSPKRSSYFSSCTS